MSEEKKGIADAENSTTTETVSYTHLDQVNVVTVQVHLTQLAASNTDAQGAQ